MAAHHAPSPRPALLTPDELSAYLGVPVRTLDTWRSRRTGPLFIRVGVHVRYRSEDVDAWIDQLRAEGERWMLT